VAVYESADQFVANLPSQERGCILLDVRMLGLNGLDLQERLRAIDSILPIVFLTGYGDIPTSVRMIKAGAEDVLPKPVSRKICWPRQSARLPVMMKLATRSHA
jgi:FixJ family two-component response regulator